MQVADQGDVVNFFIELRAHRHTSGSQSRRKPERVALWIDQGVALGRAEKAPRRVRRHVVNRLRAERIVGMEEYRAGVWIRHRQKVVRPGQADETGQIRWIVPRAP